MFPLWIFLLIWLALVSLFCLMAFISTMQMLRYGIRAHWTMLSTFLFVASSVFVLGGSGLFFLTVDWSEPIDLFSGWSNSIMFDPNQ